MRDSTSRALGDFELNLASVGKGKRVSRMELRRMALLAPSDPAHRERHVAPYGSRRPRVSGYFVDPARGR